MFHCGASDTSRRPDRQQAGSYTLSIQGNTVFSGSLAAIVTHHIPWFMKHLGANNE
jgi:hypothetical protein